MFCTLYGVMDGRIGRTDLSRFAYYLKDTE